MLGIFWIDLADSKVVNCEAKFDRVSFMLEEPGYFVTLMVTGSSKEIERHWQHVRL